MLNLKTFHDPLFYCADNSVQPLFSFFWWDIAAFEWQDSNRFSNTLLFNVETTVFSHYLGFLTSHYRIWVTKLNSETFHDPLSHCKDNSVQPLFSFFDEPLLYSSDETQFKDVSLLVNFEHEHRVCKKTQKKGKNWKQTSWHCAFLSSGINGNDPRRQKNFFTLFIWTWVLVDIFKIQNEIV